MFSSDLGLKPTERNTIFSFNFLKKDLPAEGAVFTRGSLSNMLIEASQLLKLRWKVKE